MGFNKILLTLVAVIMVSHSAMLKAFELASDNTMSSVVITAAYSSEDLINAATTPEGYGNGRYELMPFKTSIEVDVDDLHEVSTDLDYGQVLAVEKQFANERQRTESNILAETLRSYVPSSVTELIDSGTAELVQVYDELEAVTHQTAQVLFKQIQQTINTISVSMDSISYEASRYMERFSAFNIGFNQDDGSLGSVHVSDMHSVSNITMTEHE